MPRDLRGHFLRWWGMFHVGERIRNRAVRRAIAHALMHRTPTRILDAGCGRGENAWWCMRAFPEHHIDAVDISPDAVADLEERVRADPRTNCTVRVADLTDIPNGTQYGIVYSVDVFEHLRDPERALCTITAHLEPNGIVILHVPSLTQRRWFRQFEHYAQEDHEREGFSTSTLAEIAGVAGLRVDTLQYTFGPPGALAWELFHLLQRIGRPLILLTYPVLWILTLADGWFRWKRGNGILVMMENRKSKP